MIAQGGTLEAAVKVTNTGKTGAEEVVQLYVSKDAREAGDPIASLRAFKRVKIAAGQQATAIFTLDAAAFETVSRNGLKPCGLENGVCALRKLRR
ncbi:MAG: fibronectin type III-like domain-contianing protein [Spirochaetaceae bacterium]|jgi:beta-glucosidase|nr:fibronectin type III-like domain-contianing protein [Spirochaetaceae bacterium]